MSVNQREHIFRNETRSIQSGMNAISPYQIRFPSRRSDNYQFVLCLSCLKKCVLSWILMRKLTLWVRIRNLHFFLKRSFLKDHTQRFSIWKPSIVNRPPSIRPWPTKRGRAERTQRETVIAVQHAAEGLQSEEPGKGSLPLGTGNGLLSLSSPVAATSPSQLVSVLDTAVECKKGGGESPKKGGGKGRV